MNRHVIAITVACCLSPSVLLAQSTVFTVNEASASVHLGPSTVNPVIGTAPHGAVLEVTRELGSWVKIVWPAAEDGVGYVHVSMGSIRQGYSGAGSGGFTIPPLPPARSAPRALLAGPAQLPARGAADAPGERAQIGSQPLSSNYVARPTHIVGVGGLTRGPSLNVGGTARVWSRREFGLQLNVSRETAGDLGTQRVTSTQFAPSVLYSLPSHLTDYLWMRPYVGAGAGLLHQVSHNGGASVDGQLSANQLGFQTFGGGEVTFAAAPRLSVSADLGYRWYPASATGVELGGLGVSLSAHWYIK
jgi:hypothetical protein